MMLGNKTTSSHDTGSFTQGKDSPMKSSKLPKLTRWKALALVSIAVIAAVFIVYTTSSSSQVVTEDVVTLVESERELQNKANSSPTSSPSNMEDEDSEEEFNDKIRYKHTKRRLPHCLIIGCRKAGTRALLTYLNLHPNIQIAKTEVHFFDDDESYENGLDWYRKRMPYSFPYQVTMEKTPAYFTNYNVPKRVHKMNSTIKLLVIVRDPTERAISDYLQIHLNKVAKLKQTQTFEEMAIDSRTGEVDSSYPPLMRSLYHQYMWNWLQVFDLEQFLIISGEELVKNPLPQLQRVEEFLNIEHKLTSDMFYFNKTRGFYCIRNDTSEKCLNDSKGREHPPIDEDVLSRVRQYFAPYNHHFYKLVKWNFGWPEK